jgi:hypothetical protein
MKIMKKIYYNLLLIMSVFVLACSTNDIDQIDLAKQSFAPNFSLADGSPGFLNAADLAAAEIGIVVDVGHGEYQSAVLKAVYSGDADFAPVTVSEEITSLPYTQTVTASDLVALFPSIGDLTDIEIGDIFTFYVDVTLPDGTVLPGRDSDGPNYSDDVITNPLYDIDIAFGVGCPSSLEGTYDFVASGEGGGGLGALSSWTSTVTSVTLTKTGDTSYEVSNALGGIMVDYYAAYGATPVTAEITDICDDLTGTVNDGWNVSDYNGSVDGAGVITISWTNPWGDNMTITMTPN